MKKIFLSLLLTTAFFWSCKKELEPIAATTFGNLTFSAKVNGSNFHPDMNNHNSCGPNEGPIHANIQNNQGRQWYIIHANGINESIFMRLEMPLQPGKHTLIGYPSTKNGEPLHYAYYSRLEQGRTILYETTDAITGSVDVFEFNTGVNGKIHVGFEFTAKNKDTSGTVNITQGIFKNFR